MAPDPVVHALPVAPSRALAAFVAVILILAVVGCTTEPDPRNGDNASGVVHSSEASVSPSSAPAAVDRSPNPRDLPVNTLDLDTLPFIETVETGRLGRPPARADRTTGAQLVAREKPGNCVAVYPSGGNAPLWTRCFTRGSKPVPFSVISFSPNGKLLAGFVPRDEYASTDGHPRSTLLVLAARTGKLYHRFDRDLGLPTGGVRFENNQHVMFSDSTFSRSAQEEAGFKRWLVRCTLSGVCEMATPPTETSWYDTANWPS